MEQLSVFAGGEVPAVGKEASRWPIHHSMLI